jgi:hypothetical protein
MNRLQRSTLAACCLLTSFAPAVAVTSTPASAFSVTATLTSKCEVTAAPTSVAFSYTSFQTAAATSTGGAFSVRCTTNLPYTVALSTTSGTVPGVSLAYALALSASSGVGAGLTTTPYTINGTMAANQSGICNTSATACTGTDTQTVTVSY